jgi:16S rRNA processing protein RimM
MQKKDCFLFGTVFKLHGYKGDVNIYNNDNIHVNYSLLKYIFIQFDNDLVPYFIENKGQRVDHSEADDLLQVHKCGNNA